MSQSKTADETLTETHIQCEKSCKSLQNIADSLKFYQDIDIYTNSKDVSLYFERYTDLINDYHHILSKHINRDIQTQSENNKSFESIYKYITNHMKCDNINTCNIHIRYNRCKVTNNINQITNDNSLLFYIETMDTIHCHFLHTYDYGYKNINENKHKKQFEISNKQIYKNSITPSLFYIDTQMINLKQKLKNTRDNLQTVRGDIRFYNNKFVTNISNNNELTQSQIELTQSKEYENDEYKQYFFGSRDSIDEMTDEDSDSESYADGSIPKKQEIDYDYNTFGYRYYYWDYYKHNWSHTAYAKWYVYKKYKHLKDEIVNNKLCKLDLQIYNFIYYKACKILAESDIIKSIQSDYTETALHYGIKDGLSLNISNIMAIILYTDYDILSYNLSKTFDKLIYYKESDLQMKKRNSEYWNWSKILRETLECYADFITESNIKTYYHCTNYFVFNKFNARFCGPISTTPNIEIIASLVYENGIILELEPYDIGSSLRVFNCVFISSFVMEEERLSCGGYDTLKFVDIRIVKTNENYKYFINAIQLLDNILSAELVICDDEKYQNKKMKYNNEYNIAKILMEIDNNNKYKLPQYICNLFKEYCNKKKMIEIDLMSLNNDYKKFKQLFVDKRTNNLILIDFICNIFKYCEKIIIDNNKKHLSTRYLLTLLSMLKKINENKNIKLKLIKIEGIQLDEKQFNKFVQLYNEQQWDLKIKQCKTVQFGTWINIANLTVCKYINIDNITPKSDSYETGNEQQKIVKKHVMMQSVTEETLETYIVANHSESEVEF